MAVLEVQFRSEALNHEVTYSVILPDRGATPYPVLLQLHGLGDDHRSWINKSSLVLQVRELPLAVVLPNGDTAAYLNWKSAGRIYRHNYEDLIMTDISDHVKRHFNVTSDRWAIGGLSMGGYGAMRLGCKYPDRFASIWSHSSAFHINEMVPQDLVDPGAIEDADVYLHADRLESSGQTPPAIAFDCGTEDELIGRNREFDTYLSKIGLAHHYAEHPGAHDWAYWDEHVKEALEQHARALGIERSTP